MMVVIESKFISDFKVGDNIVHSELPKFHATRMQWLTSHNVFCQ
jgi:hypothetical protein